MTWMPGAEDQERTTPKCADAEKRAIFACAIFFLTTLFPHTRFFLTHAPFPVATVLRSIFLPIVYIFSFS